MTAASPHVVVDARMVTDGGIGTYLRQVLPRIARCRPQWRFTLLGDIAGLSAMQTENVGVRTCASPIYGVREQLALPLRVPADATVYWSPHYNIPVLLRSCRLVVTVHDVAHLALPQGNALKDGYARFMFSRGANRAAAILFDSEFSRAELTRFVTPRGQSTIAPLGVDESWFHARESAPSRPLDVPYMVYVGNWKRHKNVPALLRAFGRARSRIPHRLVLIGRRLGLNSDNAIDRELTALADRAIHVGEVDDSQVKRWVAHADALVTASTYEGFGLPPLEAMAAGCPTVVSRAGSLPEICEDASLYVDPLDEADIAARIVDVVTDGELRSRLIQRGRAHARGFSWDRCATATAAALERALGTST